MMPVTEQHIFLNSMPRDLGFLSTYLKCGSPPSSVVWGHHALILSSKIFQMEEATRVFILALHYSITSTNSHHGSCLHLNLSLKIAGMK
mmetsp:Transcript_23791/g.22830  ORF Transcript_23791/g.22830 Transcript_23791/m.22830 type:complete len:89 (+) Transcript_23791:51-317(+)